MLKTRIKHSGLETNRQRLFGMQALRAQFSAHAASMNCLFLEGGYKLGESRIVEFDPRQQNGGTGRYDGTVDQIQVEGLGWSARWNDTTNGTRTIDISIKDQNAQIMQIRESGNAGHIQIWEGNYRKDGPDYRMAGVLVEDNGQRPPPVAFTIQANLELP